MKNKNIKLILIISIMIILIYIFRDYIINIYENKISIYYNPQSIRNWILDFGFYGIFVFIGLQIVQVIFFFIPGEVTQIAGGYAFGTLLGSIFSLIGIMIGSVITFIISRKYGDRFLKKILPNKQYIKVKKLIYKQENKKMIFLLYLIPGMPKDIVGYVCGITNVKIKTFTVLGIVGRIPGILISAYFGSNLYHNNYKVVGIIVILIIILIYLGVNKGDVIIDYLEK